MKSIIRTVPASLATALAISLVGAAAQASPVGTTYDVEVFATSDSDDFVGPFGEVTFDGVSETITDDFGATQNDVRVNESVSSGGPGIELVTFELQGVAADGAVAPLFGETLAFDPVAISFFPISWGPGAPVPVLNDFSVIEVSGSNPDGDSVDFLNQPFTLTDVRLVTIFGEDVYDIFIELDTGSFNQFALTDLSVTLEVPKTVVPVPAAVWLFGSGLIGLLGLARRRCAG